MRVPTSVHTKKCPYSSRTSITDRKIFLKFSKHPDKKLSILGFRLCYVCKYEEEQEDNIKKLQKNFKKKQQNQRLVKRVQTEWAFKKM